MALIGKDEWRKKIESSERERERRKGRRRGKERGRMGRRRIICVCLDQKKKYNGSSDYFLNQLFFGFELLKGVPGISFTSIPFSSEMSKRELGTGIIRVDLDSTEGFILSPPSHLRRKGWKLPLSSQTDLLTCNSCYFPICILVALLVHGTNTIAFMERYNS